MAVTATSELAAIKTFKPYYSPTEVTTLLSLRAREIESAQSRLESHRQTTLAFIERIGFRVGFPRRTIATAQSLYLRFMLHYSVKDFAYTDLSVSCLLVAAKLEDTLKKLRDLQIAAYQVSNAVDGVPASNEPSQSTIDAQKNHLIGIERLLLETICFNFHLHRSLDADTTHSASDVFTSVVRIGRSIGASKSFIYLAHLLAIDVHRTFIPLSFPSHVIACAMLYLASFMSIEHVHAWQWRGEESPASVQEATPAFEPNWASNLSVPDDVIDEIALSLLGWLSIMPCQLSPAVMPSPSSSSSGTNSTHATILQQGCPHSMSPLASPHSVLRGKDELMRIQIKIRERAGQSSYEGLGQKRERTWDIASQGDGRSGAAAGEEEASLVNARSTRYRF